MYNTYIHTYIHTYIYISAVYVTKSVLTLRVSRLCCSRKKKWCRHYGGASLRVTRSWQVFFSLPLSEDVLHISLNRH